MWNVIKTRYVYSGGTSMNVSVFQARRVLCMVAAADLYTR